MSRIGKKPVEIPSNVKVNVQGQHVLIEGPKGKLEWSAPQPMRLAVKDGKLLVENPASDRQARALHGLTRSLVANMVKGVTEGYRRDLEIQGVGFRAVVQGQNLQLNVGYSHPLVFPIPQGIKISVTENTKISVEGTDKQRVGEVAAQLRRVYPPEPYKGKGIRYAGEQVRRKAGKTVTAGGGG
jgi:large subunit ribosomal protein L6